jgi:3',5'-cyclic AMP phosphodiesterase CpdA
MRLGVTSDVHFDPRGHLTGEAEVESLCERMARDGVDAVVMIGDLAVDLASFEACVRRVVGLGVPVGVLAGNHDVWRDEAAGVSSHDLLERALPEATARAGGVWLEHETMTLGATRVVGSLAWYDYSAVDAGVRASPDELAAAKRFLNNDAHRIDWGHDDREVAARLGTGLRARLATAATETASVVVVTHVPLLEEQMVRKPHDHHWALGNAYFGNLTLGHAVLGEPKVTAVASGHTHIGRDRVAARPDGPPVRAIVVASDYGAPRHVVLDLA